MTYPSDTIGSPSPDDTIKIWPGAWNNAARSVEIGNQESDDMKAATLLTLNSLIDALGAFSYEGVSSSLG
jgi:hypothetical protein